MGPWIVFEKKKNMTDKEKYHLDIFKQWLTSSPVFVLFKAKGTQSSHFYSTSY